MILTSALLILIMDTLLSNIDINLISRLLSFKEISFFITVFGLVATINAWNFIDGVNGLSSGLGAIVLLVLSFLAVGDNLEDLRLLMYIFAGTTLGFFIVNITTGRIFLGDSGAYLIGAIIAWSGVEISSKNEQISPWLIFLGTIYPASELIISTLRRIFRGKLPYAPDRQHLHSLIYSIIYSSKNLIC